MTARHQTQNNAIAQWMLIMNLESYLRLLTTTLELVKVILYWSCTLRYSIGQFLTINNDEVLHFFSKQVFY